MASSKLRAWSIFKHCWLKVYTFIMKHATNWGCLENTDLENTDLRPQKRRSWKCRPQNHWPQKHRPQKHRRQKHRPCKQVKIKKLCSIIISFPLEGAIIVQTNQWGAARKRADLFKKPGNHDQIQTVVFIRQNILGKIVGKIYPFYIVIFKYVMCSVILGHSK